MGSRARISATVGVLVVPIYLLALQVGRGVVASPHEHPATTFGDGAIVTPTSSSFQTAPCAEFVTFLAASDECQDRGNPAKMMCDNSIGRSSPCVGLMPDNEDSCAAGFQEWLVDVNGSQASGVQLNGNILGFGTSPVGCDDRARRCLTNVSEFSADAGQRSSVFIRADGCIFENVVDLSTEMPNTPRVFSSAFDSTRGSSVLNESGGWGKPSISRLGPPTSRGCEIFEITPVTSRVIAGWTELPRTCAWVEACVVASPSAVPVADAVFSKHEGPCGSLQDGLSFLGHSPVLCASAAEHDWIKIDDSQRPASQLPTRHVQVPLKEQLPAPSFKYGIAIDVIAPTHSTRTTARWYQSLTLAEDAYLVGSEKPLIIEADFSSVSKRRIGIVCGSFDSAKGAAIHDNTDSSSTTVLFPTDEGSGIYNLISMLSITMRLLDSALAAWLGTALLVLVLARRSGRHAATRMLKAVAFASLLSHAGAYPGHCAHGMRANARAFAALAADGSIAAWGDSSYGGSGAPSGTGFTAVYSTGGAFAALAADGSIVAWGYSLAGGSGAPSGTGFTISVSHSCHNAGAYPFPLPRLPSPPATPPPRLPSPPATTGTGVGMCGNTCNWVSDNNCDDGGAGSEFSTCALGSDCVDCGPRDGSSTWSPPPPSPSPPGGVGCLDTCVYLSDGDCDDGGPGSEYSGYCTLGTDCVDCGPRGTSSTDPLSSSANLLSVITGSAYCSIDSFGCVTDGAGVYSTNERCTIRANQAIAVTATYFQTERGFDGIRIGNTLYTGATGPSNVPMAAWESMTWVSDSQDNSGLRSIGGFVICPTALSSSPLATNTFGMVTVVAVTLVIGSLLACCCCYRAGLLSNTDVSHTTGRIEPPADTPQTMRMERHIEPPTDISHTTRTGPSATRSKIDHMRLFLPSREYILHANWMRRGLHMAKVLLTVLIACCVLWLATDLWVNDVFFTDSGTETMYTFAVAASAVLYCIAVFWGMKDNKDRDVYICGCCCTCFRDRFNGLVSGSAPFLLSLTGQIEWDGTSFIVTLEELQWNFANFLAIAMLLIVILPVAMQQYLCLLKIMTCCMCTSCYKQCDRCCSLGVWMNRFVLWSLTIGVVLGLISSLTFDNDCDYEDYGADSPTAADPDCEADTGETPSIGDRIVKLFKQLILIGSGSASPLIVLGVLGSCRAAVDIFEGILDDWVSKVLDELPGGIGKWLRYPLSCCKTRLGKELRVRLRCDDLWEDNDPGGDWDDTINRLQVVATLGEANVGRVLADAAAAHVDGVLSTTSTDGGAGISPAVTDTIPDAQTASMSALATAATELGSAPISTVAPSEPTAAAVAWLTRQELLQEELVSDGNAEKEAAVNVSKAPEIARMVQQLVDMGFSREAAAKALQEADGNLEAATNAMLSEGSTRASADPPPPPPPPSTPISARILPCQPTMTRQSCGCGRAFLVAIDCTVSIVCLAFAVIALLGAPAGSLGESMNYANVVFKMDGSSGMGGLGGLAGFLGGLGALGGSMGGTTGPSPSFPSTGPSPSFPWTGPSPSSPSSCSNVDGFSCSVRSDGDCDDGGIGAEFNMCGLGCDYSDCGYRTGVGRRLLESDEIIDEVATPAEKKIDLPTTKSIKSAHESAQRAARKLQGGFSMEVSYFFTVLGVCIKFESSIMGSSSSDMGCDYWTELIDEDMCEQVHDNEDDYSDSTVRVCNMRRYGTPVTVLIGICLALVFIKAICGLVRCCTGCCVGSLCINVTNTILALWAAAGMMIAVIIYSSQCYPDFLSAETGVSGVEDSYGPGFWYLLFGGLGMCLSFVLSLLAWLLECCMKKMDLLGEEQGPTVVSGTAVPSVSTSSADGKV